MPARCSLIGVALTRDLMFTGRTLNAEEALRHGLIARMAPHEELQAAAELAAREVLQSAPDAREQFKRIVNGGYGLDAPPPAVRAAIAMADPAYIEAALDSIAVRHGTICGYLCDVLDVQEDDLQRIRDTYIE